MLSDMRLMPVGGITPGTQHAFIDTGEGDFGLGGALYRSGYDAARVAENANLVVVSLETPLLKERYERSSIMRDVNVKSRRI